MYHNYNIIIHIFVVFEAQNFKYQVLICNFMKKNPNLHFVHMIKKKMLVLMV